VPPTPALIVLAAIVPPVGYALCLAALDPRRPRPWAALLASFAWGAVVASFCAARANDLLASALGDATSEPRARVLAAVAGAPLIEEVLKGAGLLLLLAARPALVRCARDGVLQGAWIGLGFEVAESLEYLMLATMQGGTAGLIRGAWVRGVLGGLKHAVFTGTVGAGLGWARELHATRARVLVSVGALLAAIAQHAAWNAVASDAITRALCGAALPDGPCRAAPNAVTLYVSVPAIVALFVGPGALALLAIARRHPGPAHSSSSGAGSRPRSP
jgi:RsiW-degrading membrane proteinase PrsW (M82 family)